MTQYRKALLLYNDLAGRSDNARHLTLIEQHFQQRHIPLDVVMGPLSREQVSATISQAVKNGVDLFLAAGGDGTVSLLSQAAIEHGVPLGILPIGTGNLLARELKIPLRFEKALELITSEDSIYSKIDTISLNNQTYTLNISTGISSRMVAGTNATDKKKLGVVAYLINLFRQLLGLQLEKFDIDCDGVRKTYSASEVLVTNAQVVGLEPLQWPETISLSDGALHLFIIRAANILDVLAFAFTIFTKRKPLNPVHRYFRFEDYCRIKTSAPLSVQADGDVVGHTPITIRVNPQSLTIITPDPEKVQLNWRVNLRKDKHENL